MRDLYELVPLFQKLNIEALEYSEILEKMLEVQSHLMTPDMQLARFGDTDAQAENELRNTMSLGAYLFGRGDFKFLGHPQLPFALLWRLGPEAAGRYEAIPAGCGTRTLRLLPRWRIPLLPAELGEGGYVSGDAGRGGHWGTCPFRCA